MFLVDVDHYAADDEVNKKIDLLFDRDDGL